MDIRRLTAAQFFALNLDKGHMTAAQLATGISYSTICDAKRGAELSVPTARKLEEWSRNLPSAKAEGVCIGAAVVVGLAAPDKLPRKLSRNNAAKAA